MKIDGAKGAGDDTLLAGNTFLPVDVVDSILGHDGPCRTVLHALGHLALPADDRHSYDRVRIDYHYLNRTLFRVVHSKTFDGADEFANLASGTALRHNGQLAGHIFLPIVTSQQNYRMG